MIIIEGVMGVGKSTLQREICQRVKMSYGVVQDFEHNVCLKDFYEGDFCIFQKQMIFLFSDYHVLMSSMKKHPGKIMISDYSLERSVIMANSYLSKYEFESLFLPCYNYLVGQLHAQPKMLILLYASPEHIRENIIKRNRAMEQEIQLQYIQDKQDLLMNELPELGFDKVIRINCDCENILDNAFVDHLAGEIQCFENSI